MLANAAQSESICVFTVAASSMDSFSELFAHYHYRGVTSQSHVN